MFVVAQLEERQIVALDVTGSNPADELMAPSTNGLGRRPFKAETLGSSPAGVTVEAEKPKRYLRQADNRHSSCCGYTACPRRFGGPSYKRVHKVRLLGAVLC